MARPISRHILSLTVGGLPFGSNRPDSAWIPKIIMRNTLRRSFTVEVKSSERRHVTIIPSRIVPPVRPEPRAFLAIAPEGIDPAVAPRRILPSLIVPEVEPKPTRRAEEQPAQRRRGRPRKVPPATVDPVAEPVAEAAPAAFPKAAAAPSIPIKRTAKPVSALMPGERWKRRLGRWSR